MILTFTLLPLVGKQSNKCVLAMSGQPAGLWKPEDCSQPYQYVCERRRLDVTAPTAGVTQPGDCPTADWTALGQYCYKVHVYS